MCCTMDTPQNIRKGCEVEEARPEPQSDWDSFLLTADFPQGSKGRFPSARGKGNITPRGGRIGRDCAERRSIGSPVPPTKMPRRRGRPKKNKEARETQVPSELRARSVAKESLMCKPFSWNRPKVQAKRKLKVQRRPEKDKYRRCRCSRTIPTAEASTTHYRRALPGKQGTKMTIGNKYP
jgi:hypothetical protein